ncbi:MAG TPA: hypothetical protein VEH84_15220 [Alphaproteobacteria bacterium]|nr:hypothetical protein [Alphaproteobacteria bacterium]
MSALKTEHDRQTVPEEAATTSSATFAARPATEEPDFKAIRENVMRRTTKARAYLAK